MEKCLIATQIEAYCFAINKSTGFYDLVCVYTDKDFAKEDLLRWQQVYNTCCVDGDDPLTCVLLYNFPTPEDIRYLIDNDLI